MLSVNEFITYSLDTNLFFLRIMKEHAFLLEIGFMPKDCKTKEKAAYFRECFESLLSEATDLASGNVSRKVLASNQLVTCCTVCAEELSCDYTGIPFNISITRKQLSLTPNDRKRPVSEQKVDNLNRRAYNLTVEFCEFQEALFSSVCDCKMFTMHYPLFIDHIIKEAKMYIKRLDALNNRVGFRDLIGQEIFWNDKMEEHAKFITGMLDPCEVDLICKARELCKEFSILNEETKNGMIHNLESFTKKSIEATKNIRDFKAQGTEGIIGCKVKSMIIPIMADHVLREANHYLCVMGECNISNKR